MGAASCLCLRSAYLVCMCSALLPGRFNQMMNSLTWMSHSQNLRRMAREHTIDLCALLLLFSIAFKCIVGPSCQRLHSH